MLVSKQIPRLPLVSVSNCKNNTLVNLFLFNKLLFSVSAGRLKYKGASKSTKIASQHVLRLLATYVMKKGLISVILALKGTGIARANIVREFTKAGIQVVKIVDRSSIAFNGCKVRKKRR